MMRITREYLRIVSVLTICDVVFPGKLHLFTLTTFGSGFSEVTQLIYIATALS